MKQLIADGFPVILSKLRTSLTLMVNQASCVQYRTSQAVIRSIPPPIHPLCTAAITGLAHCNRMTRPVKYLTSLNSMGTCKTINKIEFMRAIILLLKILLFVCPI